ncbi:MAG: redox-sensing transcriptional repressor Rex [Gemmatimonas sp.]|nr:redox-sensing transcriptional repressor Rex [Gemmatimonas sp.]
MKQNKSDIPLKTMERLVTYRRLLQYLASEGRAFVFSHELAKLANNTAAQVRRDLMIIGHHGSPIRGYGVRPLAAHVDRLLAQHEPSRVALVGAGNLGRAILAHVGFQLPGVTILAAFDSDEERTGRVIAGVRCYPVRELESRVVELGINLGILAVPAAEAQEVAERLAAVGVTGILNFAPVPLRLPQDVVVDEVDIGLKLERIALCRQ